MTIAHVKLIMINRRYSDEQCGKVATDGLHQTKKDLSALDRSGHLLSCGGAYISQTSSQDKISKTEIKFLSLPKRTNISVVLKNIQICESEEVLETEESKEKPVFAESNEPVFKYRRKKINPEQLH